MAQQPGITLIYGLGEVGMFAKVSLIEAIGNLALSIILVGPYGLLGVALGTAIPLTLFSLFVLVFSNRLIGANWRTYVRRVAPVMVVAFSLQVLAWFVVGQVEIASYSDIVLLFLTVYPTIGVVLFLIAFSSQERRAMIEATRHALGLS
jgi:O-antigen/teichoic acid export membrane protein